MNIPCTEPEVEGERAIVEAETAVKEADAAAARDAGVSVVVPAYNEAAAIRGEVERLQAAFVEPVEVLVIDDGSSDGTAEEARAAGATVIAHPVNLGQGAAIRTGIGKARGAYIALVDGDGTYPIEELPGLVAYCRDSAFEQVVGDRQSEQGSMRFLRVMAKRALRVFASFLSGQHVGDMNSGMRVLTREAAERYAPLIPDGFSNSTTLTLASLARRGRVAFVPINYSARRTGASKFRPVGDTYNMLLAIIRMVMYVDPLRVLLPVALVFVLGGSVKAVTDLFRFDLHVTTSSVLIIMTGVQIGAIALIADLIVRRTRS